MLELAILGLLKDQELHGYELKKRLTNTLGPGVLGFGRGVSFGSLYPALRRLERAGAVKTAESSGGGSAVPMTGSLGGELAAFRARKTDGRGGRGKKVYAITERGEALFEELLAAESQSSDDDRVFNLRLAFARYLPADARLGMLERRRAQLLERLVHMRARLRGGRDLLDGYARSLMEHDHETAEHDLSWVERLIASERAAGLKGPDRSAIPPASSPEPAPTVIGPTDVHRAATNTATNTAASSGSTGSPSIAGLRPAISQEDNTA
jgi:DNA-binding PadR family transcriptional regulator